MYAQLVLLLYVITFSFSAHAEWYVFRYFEGSVWENQGVCIKARTPPDNLLSAGCTLESSSIETDNKWVGEKSTLIFCDSILVAYSTSQELCLVMASQARGELGGAMKTCACCSSATLAFNVNNELENEASLQIGSPSGVYASVSGGDIVSLNADGGGCVKGNYTFDYSYKDYDTGGRKGFTGNFHLDGKQNYYNVDLTNWGFNQSISVY